MIGDHGPFSIEFIPRFIALRPAELTSHAPDGDDGEDFSNATEQEQKLRPKSTDARAGQVQLAPQLRAAVHACRRMPKC